MKKILIIFILLSSIHPLSLHARLHNRPGEKKERKAKAERTPEELRNKINNRIQTAYQNINKRLNDPKSTIPPEIISNCKGLIYVQRYKAGFIVGIEGGWAFAMTKDKNGNWSPPAFYNAGSGSIGVQAGGELSSDILFIMSEDGQEVLNRDRANIGVDISAAIGPAGRKADLDILNKTPIIAYSSAKGLFAGAAFKGGGIVSNNEYNQIYYDRPQITPNKILFQHAVSMPQSIKPLVALLNNYSNPTRTKN